MSANKRIAFKVTGEVQGVFFRKFTVKQAKGLGLTGFVKNASDGSVVGEAQGDDVHVQRLLEHLHNGPPAASVEKVEHSDLAVKSGETGFGQS